MNQPGDRIGPYVLRARNKSGGMGVVWEASAPDGRLVALKQMHPHLADDEELRRRFRREFEVGSSFAHPNLVRMLDYDGQARPPYLVMEFVQGKSLRRLLDLGGPFFEWEVATVGAQIADALVALNAKGIIHRDLKASNIVVDRGLHVVLLDYGIARVLGEETMSEQDRFIGSAEYSSPEPFWSRPLSSRSDVYSAGIVLYELLGGRVPFRSDRYTDTLRMHAERPVPRVSAINPLVSREMDSLIYAALQKQPEHRPSAEQLALACRSIVASLGRVAPPGPATPTDRSGSSPASVGVQPRPLSEPSAFSPPVNRGIPALALTLFGAAAFALVVTLLAVAASR